MFESALSSSNEHPDSASSLETERALLRELKQACQDTLFSLPEDGDAEALLDLLGESLRLFAKRHRLSFSIKRLDYETDDRAYFDEGTVQYTFFYDSIPFLHGDVDERLPFSEGISIDPHGLSLLLSKLASKNPNLS